MTFSSFRRCSRVSLSFQASSSFMYPQLSFVISVEFAKTMLLWRGRSALGIHLGSLCEFAKFYGNKTNSIKKCLLTACNVPGVRLDTDKSLSKYSLRTDNNGPGSAISSGSSVTNETPTVPAHRDLAV